MPPKTRRATTIKKKKLHQLSKQAPAGQLRKIRQQALRQIRDKRSQWSLQVTNNQGSKWAHQVKMPAAKPEDPS